MKARIFYKMEYLPDPWNETRRKQGNTAWCLVKITVPEFGDRQHEPVAMFNLNSEAEMFQGEIILAGLDKLIEVNEDMKYLVDRVRQR